MAQFWGSNLTLFNDYKYDDNIKKEYEDIKDECKYIEDYFDVQI